MPQDNFKIQLEATLDPAQVEKEVQQKLGQVKNKNLNVNLNVNSNGAQQVNNQLISMKNTAKDTGGVFSTLKNRIADTFSAAKLSTTAYLLVLNEIRKASKEAVQSIKEIDSAVTDLAVATNSSRSEAYKLVGEYNTLAKSLKTSTTAVTDSADAFLRSGKSLEQTNDLIQQSIILSKLGNIEAEDASKDLLAIMNGYKMSVDEVSQAIDVMTDMELKVASSSGSMSTALQYCASSAAMAGIDFNTLVAMIGKVQDVTQQSSESIGTFLQTVIGRYRDITIGKYLTEDGEDISNYEAVLKSVGIQIRDSEGEFRDFQEVLSELSAKWNELNSVEQSAIVKVTAGTRQQNRFQALLTNYDEVIRLADEAQNAGSAVEKYNNLYLDSIQAKTDALQASFESMVLNSDMSTVYAHILDATNALVEFIDKVNALKGIGAGLLTGGIIKGFLALRTGIVGVYSELNKFSSAYNMVRSAAKLSKSDLQSLLVLTNSLSESQTKLVLSTNNLTVSQRRQILVNQGLSTEEAQLQLQAWGLATANTGLTASTNTLKGAFEGLWLTIKSNPVGALLTVLTVLVGVATSAYSTYKQKLEDAAEATRQAADKSAQLSSELTDLISKYQALSDEVKTNQDAKDDYIETQEELLKKLGLEGESIDDLIGKYGDLDTAIKQTTIDALRSAMTDLISGYSQAEDDLLEIGNDFEKRTSQRSRNDIQTAYEDYAEQFDALQAQLGSQVFVSQSTGQGHLILSGDDSTSEGILKNYDTLEKALRILEDEFTAEELKDSKLYQDIYNRANELKEPIESYRESIRNLNQNLAQQMVLTSDQNTPSNQDEFEQFRQNLIETSIESEEFVGTEQDITEAINSYLQSSAQFSQYYKGEIEDAINTASNMISDVDDLELNVNLTVPADSLAQLKKDWSEFDDIYDDIMSGDTVSADLIDGLADAFEGINGGESLKEFTEVLSTMPDDMEACHEALNQLATDYIDNSDLIQNLTKDNAEYVESELAKRGVENAHDVVITRLGTQKNAMAEVIAFSDQLTNAEERERIASIDLANATAEEIALIINEANALGQDTSALTLYLGAKINANNAILSTSGDISNVLALCNSLGAATSYLQQFALAKAGLLKSTGSGIGDTERLKFLEKQARAEISNALSSQKANVNYGGSSSYKPSSASSSSPSRSTDKTEDITEESFDWIEVKIQRIEEEIGRLEKSVNNTYSVWSKRNQSLVDEIQKTQDEIEVQSAAYQKYMGLADSVGLSSDYISKIQNGTLDYEVIVNDEELTEKIKQYQEFYDKAVKSKDAIQELQIELGKLNEQRFDHIKSEYEGLISLIEDASDLIDEHIDQQEESGYFVAEEYYNELLSNEQSTLNTLQSEYSELSKKRDEALNSGAIEKDSEAWLKMESDINKVALSIAECNTQIIKYNNNIRQLKWDVFDYQEDRIDQITQEADFLISLLEDAAKLYTDQGAFTDEGLASAGLRTVNYDTYMQKSLDYAKERAEIEKDLAKDPYNKDLIERREKLLKLQQDSIVAANQEKQAIKSLVEEGIKINLDYLQRIIDKYSEALNSARDLYSYQKSVESLTRDIGAYQKTLLAYSGDDSEEAKKTIQETQIKLQEAQDNLRETEWDKYINETENLLNDLYDDYSEVLNARLDDVSGLMVDIITAVNESSQGMTNSITDVENMNHINITDTIRETADTYGYKLTDAMQTVVSGNKDMVSGFNRDFISYSTTVQDALNSIKYYVAQMVTNSSKEASNTSTQAVSSPQSSSNTNTSSAASSITTNQTPVSTPASPQGNGSADVGDRVRFNSGKYYENSYGGGRSGSQMLGHEVYITKVNPSGSYPYHISRGSSLHDGDLGWVKLNQLSGYVTGGKNIEEDYGWTNEYSKGEIIRRSDGAILTPLGKGSMVFNNEASQRLWELANSNITPGSYVLPQPNIPSNNVSNDVSLEFNFEGDIVANNPEEFAKSMRRVIADDSKVQGAIQAVTVDLGLGKNRLAVNRFK